LRLPLVPGGQRLGRRGDDVEVGVTHVGDLDVVEGGEAAEQVLAAVANAEDGQYGLPPGPVGGAGGGEGGQGSSRGAEEGAAVEAHGEGSAWVAGSACSSPSLAGVRVVSSAGFWPIPAKA